MKITRTAAVAMFVSFGFKIAEKWDNAKLNKRISQIPDQVDEAKIEAIEDAEVKGNVTAVLKALDNDEAVEIIEDEDAAKPAKGKASKAVEKEETPAEEEEEETPPAKPSKAEKPAKAEKAAKAPKAEKASKAETDKLGSRIGSQGAEINAQLAKKWTSIADVAKATKYSEARVRAHFKFLERNKKGEYDAEKGFRLS